MKIKELFKGSGSNQQESVKSKGDNQQYSKAYRIEDIKKLEENVNIKEKNFSINDLGAYTFKTTLFKDELRTPHFEIQKSLDHYDDMPNINAGINQIVLFITGNEVRITSTDGYTTKWFDKWTEQRAHITDSIKLIVQHNEVCGNSWIEPVWSEIDGKKYMNDFRVMPDPSRVYYNLTQDADLENEFWIYQVPYIFRQYGDMDIKVFRISYVKNGIAWQETVYGVGLKEDDLIHIKTGTSRYGYYGRSYLAATINDGEIITQMLKNYAIASRFMAFGKKIVSLGDENDIVSTDELKKFTAILNSPEDEEHIAINKKVNIQDITPSNFNEMSNGLDYVRKDISAGLLPNFMTPWSDTMGSYSATNNAKIPFELSLENKRNSYIKMLNKKILEPIMKQNPKLKDATFEFGEVTLDDSKDTQTTLLELYNNDVITLNQLLKGIGRDTVENGDIYKTTRNYIYQKKYSMDQSDVEGFQEPFMQRKVQKDIERDNGYNDFNRFEEPKERISTQFKEKKFDDYGSRITTDDISNKLKKIGFNIKDKDNSYLFAGKGDRYEDGAITYVYNNGWYQFQVEKKGYNAKIFKTQNVNMIDNKINEIMIYLKESFQESINLKEQVVNALKFIETDKDFIKEIKKKYDKEIEVIKTTVVKDSNIIRLCKDVKSDAYIIYNNNNIINDKDYIDKELAIKKYNLEIENARLEYENFIRGDSEIDKASQELFKYAKEIQWEATKELLEELKKSSMKEGYGKKILKEKNVINPSFLGKVDGLFDVFNNKLKSKVDEMVNKLSLSNVEIIDDMGTDSLDNDAEVKSTKDMLSDLIFDQFKTFNQNQSQNIKRILSNGIISGSSTSEIEQELKDTVVDWKKYKPSENDYKISRIANTEMHRSGLQLKLLEWKKMGINHVIYRSHVDDKVRDSHRKLNNKIFTIDEALQLEEWKEINCRCSFSPISV